MSLPQGLVTSLLIATGHLQMTLESTSAQLFQSLDKHQYRYWHEFLGSTLAVRVMSSMDPVTSLVIAARHVT